jgi:tetratricopeptide (TPR) repeat protein
MWAGADDIFKGDANKLREFVDESDKEEFNIISMNYIYGFEKDRGTACGGIRKRLHQDGTGTWKYKSHELYIENETAKEIFYSEASYWHEKMGERYTGRNIQLIEDALKDCPEEDRARYYYVLAREYRCLEQIDKAVEFFKKYVAISPERDNKGAWYELACCLLELGQCGPAKRAAFESILINPYYKYPYCTMGKAYADEGNWPQVIVWMRAALEIDPHGWDRVVNHLGVQGDFDDEATITYVPWEHLGLAYWNLGDYKTAYECFVRCLEWLPDDETYRGYIKDLKRYLAEDSIK